MMHLYSALLCIAVHTKRFTIMWGGGGIIHFDDATASTGQRCKCAVCSLHTSYRWRERRVIEPIKWMGIIRRPWLIRDSGGNLARTPGLHPYSLGSLKWHGIQQSMVTHTLNLCSAFNPSKVNIHSSKHSHCEHTPGAVGSHLCCSTRGAVGGSMSCSSTTLVVVSRVERALYIHSPTYNPCRPETWTHNLSITSPTLYH